MPFFNPLKFLVFPFVFVVAFPLALFAGATTIIAFLVLFMRLFLVYFDVSLETVRYVLVGHATQAHYTASRGTPSITPVSSSTNLTSATSPASTSFKHRRRGYRRAAGSGPTTPAQGHDGLSMLTPSIGLERDFEGIGGWRLDSFNQEADAPDEQQWYNLNSRLEIPSRRHHFRSQSGGAITTAPGDGSRIFPKSGSLTASHSPERAKTASSPTRARSRTPRTNMHQGFNKGDQDGYFPLHISKSSKKVGI